MTRLFVLFAAGMIAAPVLAQQGDPTVEVDFDSTEYKFVQCVNERDQSLLYAMRDAESIEAMQEAGEKAFLLCPEFAGDGNFSMGRFFNAVASFIGKPTYDDQPEGDDNPESDDAPSSDEAEAAE